MILTSKEMLTHYFLQGYVHLSKKDYGFFNNISYITNGKKSITSNQDKLFNKLILKYQRQLKKLGHETDFLTSLEWKTGIVDSNQEFLRAKVIIIDEDIRITSPFNNKFVQDIRKASLSEFVWNKSERYYEAPYSTQNLKLATSLVKTHFKDWYFCDTISSLLKQVDELATVKYWNPTLIKVKNNFFVCAINETLADAIAHIEINDDPNNVFLLTQYGVSVDKSVYEDNELLKFVSDFHTVIDLDNIDKAIECLNFLNVDHVFTSRDLIYNKTINNEIKFKLLEKSIALSPITSAITNYNKAVMFTTSSFYPVKHSHEICKVIQLKNSRPINIK